MTSTIEISAFIADTPADPVARLALADALEENHGTTTDQIDAIRHQAGFAAQHNLPVEITIPLTPTVKMEVVLIPPGEFWMGATDDDKNASEDEKPRHKVRIGRAFYAAKYPCTQEQYQAVIGSNPSHFHAVEGAKRCPVESVNWHDSVAFCAKLTEMLPGLLKDQPHDWNALQRVGARCRLPEEWEWEYFARAGSTTVFPWGNSLNGTEANVDGSHPYGTTVKGPYLGRTCPVGSYQPNFWGLYDVIGNVWEWCQTPYDADAYKNRAKAMEGEDCNPLGDAFAAVPGSPTPTTADHPIASGLMSATVTTPAFSDPSSTDYAPSLREGEEGDPFESLASGGTHGSIAARVVDLPTEAASQPFTHTEIWVSAPPLEQQEGEEGDPFAFGEGHGTSSPICVSRLNDIATMPLIPSGLSDSVPSSEGEEGYPLGSDVLGEDRASSWETRDSSRLEAETAKTYPSMVSAPLLEGNSPPSEGEESYPFVSGAHLGTSSPAQVVQRLGAGTGLFTTSYTAASAPASDDDGRRCLRGGSWIEFSRHCRFADRFVNPPVIRNNSNGFRLVIS